MQNKRNDAAARPVKAAPKPLSAAAKKMEAAGQKVWRLRDGTAYASRIGWHAPPAHISRRSQHE